MTHELAEAIRRRSAILFVGAGVSANLGLPSHKGLMAHMARELGFDPALFIAQGDYLSLAEYYQLTKGSIGALRSWMDRTWHDGVDIAESDIHRLVVELDFPLIYTTNYDEWIERAYAVHGKQYVKVVNVGDIVKAGGSITQIVKFHGDFSDDASIVLNESSYFGRLDFESPLDVKLRSDLLGRAVLFIGYSLSDINIRYMLYRLDRLWKRTAFATARPRSFMFLARPNVVEEKILESRGIVPLVSEQDDPGLGLREFLQRLSDDVAGRLDELPSS